MSKLPNKPKNIKSKDIVATERGWEALQEGKKAELLVVCKGLKSKLEALDGVTLMHGTGNKTITTTSEGTTITGDLPKVTEPKVTEPTVTEPKTTKEPKAKKTKKADKKKADKAEK